MGLGRSRLVVHRLKGVLLEKRGKAHHAQAGQCFLKSLEAARQQNSKSELRAAISLAELWTEQGRKGEARTLLNEV